MTVSDGGGEAVTLAAVGAVPELPVGEAAAVAVAPGPGVAEAAPLGLALAPGVSEGEGEAVETGVADG